jgi:probable rRNA maturation factor
LKTRQTLNNLTQDCAKYTLKHLKLDKVLKNAELSVLITDNKTMQKINKETRGKNYATNVLSFPFLDFKEGKIKSVNETKIPIIFGDIICSYEKLQEEAEAQNKPINNHFTHLMVHSILHLLGFDHEKPKDAKKMEALEIEILKKYFRINNPYVV